MTTGPIPPSSTGSIAPPATVRTIVVTAAQPPTLKGQADSASKIGGMLSEHILAVQEVATKKQVCIMVRPVNADATSLIGLGFGTKDMAIKGKSSNLPPFSGMIPLDQRFGKGAFDPEKEPEERLKNVKKWSAANDASIAHGTAKAVDLRVPGEHFALMMGKADGLRVHGTWNAPADEPGMPNEGLMSSVKDGTEFKFWGERHADGSVSVFEVATVDGTEGKGAPVKVMANRQGKAVTADYDLAIVAPRLQDYGADFTRPMKVTSAEEQARRLGVGVKELEKPAPNARQWDANQLHKAQTEWDRQTARTGSDANGKATVVYRPFELDPSKLAPMPADATRLSVFQDQIQIAEGGTQELYDPGSTGSPLKDFGNLSKFTRRLLPELNKACDRQDGLEVFHHSDDAGNPFSDVDANYPLTAILPDSSALDGLDRIQIIRNGADLTTLVRSLKNAGFMPVATDRWNDASAKPEDRLTSARSDDFLETRKNMARIIADKTTGGATASPPPEQPVAAKQTMDQLKAARVDRETAAQRTRFTAARDLFEKKIDEPEARRRMAASQALVDEIKNAIKDAEMSRKV